MDTKRLNLFQYLSTAWWVLQGIFLMCIASFTELIYVELLVILFCNFEELQKESYKDIGSYRSDNIYGNRIYNYFYAHCSCKPHPSWTCLLIDNRCIQYNIFNI